MKRNCGINPQLMVPCNYARTLFETPHSVLLENISDSVRKDNLSSILNIFLHLRKVYRCQDPLTECPFDVQNYKKCAVEMGGLLFQHFDYALGTDPVTDSLVQKGLSKSNL